MTVCGLLASTRTFQDPFCSSLGPINSLGRVADLYAVSFILS